MPRMLVTSEIYDEFDYDTNLDPKIKDNVISKFPFTVFESQQETYFDDDNDLVIKRRKKESIIIEHSVQSSLALVGLQVWRGALLLGDLMIYLGLQGALAGKKVLELGAGTGLTSFVASMYADRVISTDLEDILGLIKLNAAYNKNLIKSEFKVMPLDFTKMNYKEDLQAYIVDADIIIAADVIYDDEITKAFVLTLQKILDTNPPKTLYMALEKRYVFTVRHLESVAPCYETFLTLLNELLKDTKREWKAETLTLDFPQYFVYDRVKELVLWKITSEVKRSCDIN